MSDTMVPKQKMRAAPPTASDDEAGEPGGRNGESTSDRSASAQGIAQCLRMLADEAASIGLVRTQHAMQEALRLCALESTRDLTRPAAMLSRNERPPGSSLH